MLSALNLPQPQKPKTDTVCVLVLERWKRSEPTEEHKHARCGSDDYLHQTPEGQVLLNLAKRVAENRTSLIIALENSMVNDIMHMDIEYYESNFHEARC
jgi:hypothetical protein